eukprot:Clim_evm63s136 gene=Clim_evmTU63s136
MVSIAEVEALSANIRRCVTSLEDSDKITRREAAGRLGEAIGIGKDGNKVDNHLLDTLTADEAICLLAPLDAPVAALLSDPSEKSRDLAVSLLRRKVSVLYGFLRDQEAVVGKSESQVHTKEDKEAAQTAVDKLVPYLMPHLLARLVSEETKHAGGETRREPSEEIRLHLYRLVQDIIQAISQRCLMLSMADFVHLLGMGGMLDRYPEIKRLSCELVSVMGSRLEHRLRPVAVQLLRPLDAGCLHHQHSKIRAAAVKALGVAAMYGACDENSGASASVASNVNSEVNKGGIDVVIALMDSICIEEQSGTVRLVCCEVVGQWLMKMVDRYTYTPKLLPYLLLFRTDAVEEIAECADVYLSACGEQYIRENEEELKDKVNFGLGRVKYLVSSGNNISDSAEGDRRDALGVQLMVQQALPKMLPQVLKQLDDWAAVRRKAAAAMLHEIIFFSGDHFAGHVESILDSICLRCVDEEPQVAQMTMQVAGMIGGRVQFDIILPLTLQRIEHRLTQSATRVAALILLHEVIMGLHERKDNQSNEDAVMVLLRLIPQILAAVGNPDVLDPAYPQACNLILNIIWAILSQCTTSEHAAELQQYSLQVHQIIIRVLACKRGDEKARGKSRYLFEILASKTNPDAADSKEAFLALNRRHFTLLHSSLAQTAPHWTRHSEERFVYDAVLDLAGPVVGEHLGEIVPVIESLTEPERDVELRLGVLMTLIKLLIDDNDGGCNEPTTAMNATSTASQTVNSTDELQLYLSRIIVQILLPNTVWRAGRTAAAVRLVSLSALWALLKASDIMALEELIVQTVPGPSTEKPTSTVLAELTRHLQSTMDDGNQHVRMLSVRMLTIVLEKLADMEQPGDEITSTEKARERADFLHSLYPDLCKRMDDSSDKIRSETARCLEAMFVALPADYPKDLYRAHLEYCWKPLLIHLDDSNETVRRAVLAAVLSGVAKSPELLQSMATDNLRIARHRGEFEVVLAACKKAINE